MTKIVRMIFCVLMLAVCFQLAGVEEAFCEDSALDTGCQACVTCVGQPFAFTAADLSLPTMNTVSYCVIAYRFHDPAQPLFSIFRPPISR